MVANAAITRLALRESQAYYRQAMDSTSQPVTAAALLAIIENPGAGSEQQVRLLVQALDLDIAAAIATDPRHGIAEQALARAVAAIGRPLLAHCDDGLRASRVRATLAAAGAYARDPSDETGLALAVCATASYPYGPGDGCLAITDMDHCGPGSGCISGAGTLHATAWEIGFGEAMRVLAAELAPWLRTWHPETG